MPTKKSRTRRVAILVGVSVLEVCFRASATLVAQPLKRHVAGDGYVLSVPMLHLFLETCSFPVSLLAWIAVSLYNARRIHIQNWRYRVPMYFVMAILDCISCFAASVGLNVVPASIFTILGSAAIVFSIILMKVFTKKKFTPWHFISVGMTFVSVSMLFVKTATNGDELRPTKSTDLLDLPKQQVSFFVAMLCCLLSAFLIALMGVLNYVFFTHENLKYDVSTILENNAIQSLFVAAILLPVALTSPEAAAWPRLFQHIQQHGNPRLFFGVCVGIWLSRSVILFSSVATTAFASAVLTRALGGPRRVLVMILSWLIFQESMPVIKILSGVLMVLSTIIYVYGGYKLQQQDDKDLVEKDLELQSSSSITKKPA